MALYRLKKPQNPRSLMCWCHVEKAHLVQNFPWKLPVYAPVKRCIIFVISTYQLLFLLMVLSISLLRKLGNFRQLFILINIHVVCFFWVFGPTLKHHLNEKSEVTLWSHSTLKPLKPNSPVSLSPCGFLRWPPSQEWWKPRLGVASRSESGGSHFEIPKMTPKKEAGDTFSKASFLVSILNFRGVYFFLAVSRGWIWHREIGDFASFTLARVFFVCNFGIFIQIYFVCHLGACFFWLLFPSSCFCFNPSFIPQLPVPHTDLGAAWGGYDQNPPWSKAMTWYQDQGPWCQRLFSRHHWPRGPWVTHETYLFKKTMSGDGIAAEGLMVIQLACSALLVGSGCRDGQPGQRGKISSSTKPRPRKDARQTATRMPKTIYWRRRRKEQTRSTRWRSSNSNMKGSCRWPNNGINYQPQPLQDLWTINTRLSNACPSLKFEGWDFPTTVTTLGFFCRIFCGKTMIDSKDRQKISVM